MRALGLVLSTAYLIFNPSPAIVTAYPTEQLDDSLDVAKDNTEIAPFNTPLAKFWQQTNDWANDSSTTTTHASLEKRINLPVGRSQFVSYVQNSQGGPRDWIMSLAVVVYTNYPARQDCVALWQSLGADLYVAEAIAGNAADEIARFFPNLGQLTSQTAFFTYNYFGSQVVVAKLHYSNVTPWGIRLMAGALSGAWGLGDIVSEFEPTNSPKRDESAGHFDSGGIVSSAPYTSEEMRELHFLMRDMENRSTPHSGGGDGVLGLDRRAPSCPSVYLGNCRNADWAPWNTQWHYDCSF